MTTGTNSSHQILEDTPADDTPHRGPVATSNPNPAKETRQKWTREEYKLVVEAYYMAVNNPSEATTTKAAYNIWRQQNPTTRLNLDANKLANVRRDIIKNNRLTDVELEIIQEKIRQTVVPSEELNNPRPTPGVMDNQEACETSVDENHVDQHQMPDLHASPERIECQETSEIRTLILQK